MGRLYREKYIINPSNSYHIRENKCIIKCKSKNERYEWPSIKNISPLIFVIFFSKIEFFQ